MKLTLTGLGVDAGGKAVLGPLTAVLPAAAVTAVVGRNGAGKSTLLRALTGIAPPSRGRVELGGLGDLATLPAKERARHLAWVPALAAVPFDYTVLDLVVIGRFPRHQGRPSRLDLAAAEAALCTVGASALARRRVSGLSSGELARAQVARGLAAETPVLVLDEPTANLDVAAALALMQTLTTLARAGRTVVLSLHDLTAAWRYADHVLCLDEGRLCAAGPAHAVLTPQTLAQAFHVKAAVARAESGAETLVFDP